MNVDGRIITIELHNCHYNDLLNKFPDKFIDIAICDIPYGINASKMAFTRQRNHGIKQKNGTVLDVNKNIYTQKEWDNNVPPQEYFDEICRVSKHQIIFGVEYINWKGLGSGRIKWDKCIPEGVSFKGYEMAYCSLIDYEMEIKLLWSGMNQAKSLTEPTTQQGNKKLNEKDTIQPENQFYFTKNYYKLLLHQELKYLIHTQEDYLLE